MINKTEIHEMLLRKLLDRDNKSCSFCNYSNKSKTQQNLSHLPTLSAVVYNRVVQFEWRFLYLWNLWVFGGKTDGNAVSNGTMGLNEISPISPNDTTNPEISAKVNSSSSSSHQSTTTKRCNKPPLSYDNHREAWWIRLSTMLSRVGTTLKTPRSKFTKLACMRRRRERSATHSIKFPYTKLPVTRSVDWSFDTIKPLNDVRVCTRRPIPGRGLIEESHLAKKQEN